MRVSRSIKSITFVAFLALAAPAQSGAQSAQSSQDTLDTWYRLSLELVRHTPTYSPPVASRAFAYIGVTAYEAVASGSPELTSLAGQLNGLTALPKREAGQAYDDAVILQAALAKSVSVLFRNTGPTGQRALASISVKQRAKVANGVAADVVARSESYGQSVADQILAWAATDGGAVIENLGFPDSYSLTEGPAYWVPTNTVRLQQTPLLPSWGKNRTFAMPSVTACDIPPPSPYSEDPASAFYAQAKEVVDVKKNLTPEQKAIAWFWADDAMLTSTPAGHWVAIALQIDKSDQLPLEQSVDILARLGIATADAFIGAWNEKYEVNLLRPLTYIRRTMDPKWEPFLNTPPFPEYPSGHSVLSAAAASVMTAAFGDAYAFDDASRADDGLPMRAFPSFWAAAKEASISRLYGGIHFSEAINNGMDLGRCIATYSIALKTRSEG